MAFSMNSGSIIIANSKLEVESYNYLSMKTFTNNDIEAQKDAQANDEKKAIMEPTWKCNIGEQAR